MAENKNHEADMENANEGSEGTNESFQQNIDNTSDQLNPNNLKFWIARGYEKRPDNWKEILKNS